MMGGQLSSVFRRLMDDEDGSQSIEFLLIVPILVWAVLATYEFTSAFRARAMAYDATAVVTDTLSRQTTPIDQADLEGLRAVAGMVSGYGGNTTIRVTQVRCTDKCDDLARRTLRVVFSHGVGMTALTDTNLASGATRNLLPLMAQGDRVVLAETQVVYRPTFSLVGLKAGQVTMAQAMRMRFAPQLCWEACNPA